MKIHFFLTSRYPTHKAYGVTTGETARELREIGNEIKIVAPGDSNSKPNYDNYHNEVLTLFSPISNFARRYFSNLTLIGPLIFILTSIAFARKAVDVFRREKPDVIWMRDYWVTLFLARRLPTCKFVLEIHQSPSFTKHLLLLFLRNRNRIGFITIQGSLKEELTRRYPGIKVFLGPMGASNEFFSIGRLKNSSVLEKQDAIVKVCYLGRMTSSGVDNGIFQLLKDWKAIPTNVANLTLVGLSNAEIKQITSLGSLGNLFFAPSINHLDVPKALVEFDCGLVPYPEGQYHRTRFPIKIVEYCASGLNIIVNDTSSNRALLGEDFAFFYKAGDSDSLLRILEKIRGNRLDSRRRAERGFVWAQDYTYSKRLRDVYPFLEGRIN